MENQQDKELSHLQQYVNSERRRVITEGDSIINFNTITALCKMNFTGSNQTAYLLNDNTVVLCFIHDRLVWDLKENKVKNLIVNLGTNKLIYIAPNIHIELRKNNSVINYTSTNSSITLKIQADDVTMTNSSIVFGSSQKIVIVNKENYAISQEIGYNNIDPFPSSTIKRVENMVSLNDYYIASIIKNKITIFDLTDGISQSIFTIVLNKKKNTFYCFIDLSNGRVIEQKKKNTNKNMNMNKITYSSNHYCVLVASGIPKRLIVFKAEKHESIAKLIEDEKVVRIDKIDNNERYIFVMANYFFVYDTVKKEYIQKIASLFTNRYCLCRSWFVYFSTPVFYSVKIDIQDI